MENTLERIAKCRYKTKMDKHNGFWQVALAQENCKLPSLHITHIMYICKSHERRCHNPQQHTAVFLFRRHLSTNYLCARHDVPGLRGRLILRVSPRGVPRGSPGGTWSKGSAQCARSARIPPWDKIEWRIPLLGPSADPTFAFFWYLRMPTLCPIQNCPCMDDGAIGLVIDPWLFGP